MPELIGETVFPDGTRRPVFLDGMGQYVIGDDGERIYGVFLIPEELSGFSEAPWHDGRFKIRNAGGAPVRRAFVVDDLHKYIPADLVEDIMVSEPDDDPQVPPDDEDFKSWKVRDSIPD